jgi:group I intron endonuclease
METWRSMYLYEIRNSVTGSIYVGITRGSLAKRWREHKFCARKGIKTPLYDSIRTKGVENFSIHEVMKFDNEMDMLQAEKDLISFHRLHGKCYNLLDGGEAYFAIKDWDAHKAKLRAARVGRKPALGMIHSDENKRLFSESGKKRWDMHGRYPDDVINYSFKDANVKFGISKTHFYRLKLAKPNELS